MNRFTRYIIAFGLIIFTTNQLWGQTSYLATDSVTLKRERRETYTLLNNLSIATGLNFIYDSNLIKNEQKTRTNPGNFTLEQAIKIVTNNPNIEIQIDGNHALLYIPSIPDIAKETSTEKSALLTPANTISYLNNIAKPQSNFTIQGRVLDKITKEPLEYASITIDGKSIGTVANSQGEFRLVIHDSLTESHIKISHLGYQSRVIPSKLLKSNHTNFMMEPKIVSLQEVVVRVIDGATLVEQIGAKRAENYSTMPVNLTTFYREAVEYKKSISLAEAVLEVYQAGAFNSISKDQVRVLKMRKIIDPNATDTLFAKLKSSINSALLLDIARNLPDFLSLETMGQYNFEHTDITTLDQRRVYVISFTQKEHLTLPLYSGKLYIDAQNFALVEANFQINPKFIKAAKYDIIIKESKGYNIMPQNVQYIASYKLFNGKYYINHIKGELFFKVNKRRKLSNSPLHIWFEMVTCIIEEQTPSSFERTQRLNLNKIFSETTYSYDPLFWENFNIILPEEKIIEIIENYNFNM